MNIKSVKRFSNVLSVPPPLCHGLFVKVPTHFRLAPCVRLLSSSALQSTQSDSSSSRPSQDATAQTCVTLVREGGKRGIHKSLRSSEQCLTCVLICVSKGVSQGVPSPVCGVPACLPACCRRTWWQQGRNGSIFHTINL
jgi:hypothetical protein